MTIHEQVVEEARKWKGTPFKHQGRKPGIGCDCVGLLIGIAGSVLGVRDTFDYQYGRDPNNWAIKKELDSSPVLFCKEDKHDIAVGDIAIFHLGKHQIPHHVGIISDYSDISFGIIHCYQNIGRVVEHRMNDVWKKRIMYLYRCKE